MSSALSIENITALSFSNTALYAKPPSKGGFCFLGEKAKTGLYPCSSGKVII